MRVDDDDDVQLAALLHDEPDAYERPQHADVDESSGGDSEYSSDDDDDDVPHASPAKAGACSSRRCRTLATAIIAYMALALLVAGIGLAVIGFSLQARANDIAATGWTERTCVVLETHAVYANASHVQALANATLLAVADEEHARGAATQLCTWTTVKLADDDRADVSACGVPSYIARHSGGSGACFDVAESHRRPMAAVNDRRRCLWPANVPVVSPRECTLGVLDTSTYSRIVHAELRRFVYLYEDAAEAHGVLETATHELHVLGTGLGVAGIVALLLLCFMSAVFLLLLVARARFDNVFTRSGKLARD